MKIKTIIITLSVFLMTSCATAISENKISLPNQDINLASEEGKTTVIIYNNTNKLMWLTSHKIMVAVDGLATPWIPSGKYLVLSLQQGEHELILRHWDALTFTDTYQIKVEGEKMYINIFNKVTSTEYKIDNELPENFKEKYTPVIANNS